MSTLYIDRSNLELRLEGCALTFYEDDRRVGTVPTAPLERVVLRGAARIEAQAVAKLGELGVGVIFLCGRRHEPVLFLPRMHNDAERRINQCVLSRNEEFRRLAALDVVRAKIDAQAGFLRARAEELSGAAPERLLAAVAELKKLRGALDVKSGDASIRGVEGSAAKAYFSGLSSLFSAELGFTTRNRRPPRDPVNAVLSLGYVLLYADATMAAHETGLDPFVGFLHRTEFSRHSLACDLMEPARPLIDRFALNLFLEGELALRYFSTTASGCFMQKEARVIFYKAYEKAAVEWRALVKARARKLADDILRASNLPSLSQTA